MLGSKTGTSSTGSFHSPLSFMASSHTTNFSSSWDFSGHWHQEAQLLFSFRGWLSLIWVVPSPRLGLQCACVLSFLKTTGSKHSILRDRGSFFCELGSEVRHHLPLLLPSTWAYYWHHVPKHCRWEEGSEIPCLDGRVYTLRICGHVSSHQYTTHT